jgi:TolB-like protein
MTDSRAQRRLAAILAADVVGFSRLMEADEAGTLAALKTRRKDVLEPLVARHQGRVFKITGDGVLVEFGSAVNAVQCAIELQQGFADANKDVADERRIVLRIGVNLGDVIVEGGDLYGDGVNIAARLEALAEPGGVLVSGTAYDYVNNKVKVGFEDLGGRTLKNIAQPVRAFRVTGTPAVTAALIKPGSDKPAIAVLPFTNMSGDPEQEYFSDGISEDLITELSKFRSLFVVSRNSAFAFKGQSISVKEISGKLRVRYIVEGSVRRSADRLRITAQLIDAIDDKHLWAERYDRRLADIFDVQDEVVRAIVLAIEPQLLSSERSRALRKPPEHLDAWENHQRGLWHLYQYKRKDRDITLSFFERAVAIDPGFAPAHAGLAYGLYLYILLGASPDIDADLERAHQAAELAITLDEHDPFAHVAMCRVCIAEAKHDMAMRAAENAIRLNPNLAMAHFGRGHALWHAGRAREAIAPLDEAMRLSPQDPAMTSFQASKAIALALSGEPDGAIEWSRRAQEHPNVAIFSYVGEICALGLLGRSAEAAVAIARARKVMPGVTVSHLAKVLPITHAPSRDLFLSGLRKAGVPE